MPTSLEPLKTRKETIREELDQLKSLSQSQEKEQKQEKIATEISELDQELQAYLAQESDASKKAEAQEVVKELVIFSSALESLKQEVLKKGQAPVSTPDTETFPASAHYSPAETEEEKSVWIKTKDFVGEHWDKVTSSETWKEETGKNLLRTAGFVGTGVGAFMLLKKGRNWAF